MAAACRRFVLFVALLAATASADTKDKERKKKMKRMVEKQEQYVKPELSESKDYCKQCEFVVARLSGHVLASATDGQPLPKRDQWIKRLPQFCEPLNTPACLQFLKLYGGLLSDELAEMSAEARELGEDEPSLSNVELRKRLCDDVLEACQKHHNVIRSADVALVVRNSLRRTKARLFWMKRDEDGVWSAVIPESMTKDHVILPGDSVRIQAKRGHQFVVLPEGVSNRAPTKLFGATSVRTTGADEDNAPRLVAYFPRFILITPLLP